jgi:signal transduction histidine kinase
MLPVVLSVLILSQCSIGLLIFLQSRHAYKPGQRLFALITLLIALWTITNSILLRVDILGSASETFLPLVNRAAFLLVGLILACIYLFNFTYPIKKNFRTIGRRAVFFGGLGLAAVAPLNAIAGSFTISGDRYVYHYGPLVVLVALYAIIVIGSVYINGLEVILHEGRNSRLRQQALALLIGITLTIIHGVVFLLVLPAAVGQHTALYVIGYMAPYYLILSTSYGLLRLGLFDVRFFVVRAAAYLTTLLVVTFALVTPVILGFGHFLDFHPSKAQLATVVFLGVCVLYLLQYLRKLFDRLTARVFFRHYYDPQEVLDKLSDILVRTSDVAMLRSNTSVVLKEALKPSFLRYVLFADQSEKDAELAKKIGAHSPASTSNIIDADELKNKSSRLATVFKNEDIALAMKLRTTHENLGYMIVGLKQSGEIYSDRDRRLLGVAADEIAISLQNALRFEEIQRFNETLQRKVTDATFKLRKTNEKLRLLDQTKDDFIGMASHQLRTPLTSVKGYLSLVLDGDAGPIKESQRKLLNQSFVSAQRMVYLIADLLNVSRLRTGKFVIEPSPINLADLVQGEVEQLQETAEGRSQTLTYHKPEHFPVLNMDETKTRQVVMNFIDNALHYTPQGGHITVTLENTPKTIEFRVVDDGIGVPKGEQHHLFTKFYRAQNAQKARPDGTGLGLFMAKKVVVGQGGATIFSSQEGKGSTFGFTFPKASLQGTPAQKVIEPTA